MGICERCGFIFTQNPFTEEQLANRYKNFSKFEYDDEEYFLDYGYAANCARQKHFIKENIDLSEIQSVFEIGAASGYNLSLYKTENCNVYGVEPSEKNCRLAKKHYSVEMFNGMFDEYLALLKHDKFDLIFLSMVLEHIVNPANFIKECKKITNKYVFIEVPTLDVRCVEEPFGIFCEEHVNLFTLDSLNNLMNNAGFKLINATNIYELGQYLPAGYPAMMTIWEKTSEKIMPFQYNIFNAEELLNKYIEESKKSFENVKKRITKIPDNEKLAIWGIGHHASMLLANTELKNKNIVKVYDSDLRKEGTTFAGIEIHPFNKTDIDSGEVESILLATYTAQKNIQRYIKKINLNCKIYTLYDL